MQKLLLLTTACFLFGGCYTQLKSDGDYWGYTGKSKRDKVVVIEERTDTVVVTSQDTIVTDPTFIEPEPERTVIINNYYPDYSIYSVSPFAYRHWYPGPHVSFSISFGAPYHHHDYFYDHYRPYWSWWDRPWYYDPYYYHPYYAWHRPYYDPWWGWYDPYTCLRPSYYPWWYYDNHHNWHHHNYTYDNNDYRGNRRRGRIGGEDRAGNSNTTGGGGSNRAGKTITSTKAAAPVGKVVQVRKDPGVQIVTDNTEGIRTAVPSNESHTAANSESTTTEKTKTRTVTAPSDFHDKDEVVFRGSNPSTSSTPAKKVVVKSVAPANKTASPSVSSSSSKRSANQTAPASESTKPSRSSSDNSGSSKSSGSTTGGSSYSKPSAPSSSGSYSGGRSSSSSGSSSGGRSSGGSSGGSSSSSSGSNSNGGRASRSSR